MKSRSTARLSLPLATAIAALLAPQSAQAVDYWWDSNSTTGGFGSTTGTWGTSTFWSTNSAGTSATANTAITSADVVNFGTATLNYANGTIGIAAGGVTVNSIVYGTAQTTAINLGTAGNALTLAGTTPTITVNNLSATHTIISPIAGSAGLTKAGNGILVLSGTNTYTGGTSVNAGTLGFRNLASKVSSGTHAFAAGTTLGLGVGSAGFFTTTDVDNAFAGTMTGNLSNVTVAATTNVGIDSTAGNVNYATNIASVSRGLTKLGINTLTLGANNAYTGATTIAGGTLAVSTFANAGANSSIGNFATAGATGLTLSGGTFNYTGASTTTDRGFTAIGSVKNTISVGTGVNLSLGASVKSESTAIAAADALTFTASGAGSSITFSSLTITAGTNPDFNISTNTPTVTIQNLNVTGSNVIAQRTGTALLNVGNINGTGASGWLSNMNVTGVISGYTGTIVLGADVTLSGLSTFNAAIQVQQAGIYKFNSIKNVNGGASALGAPTNVTTGTIIFGNGGNTPTLEYNGTGDTSDRVLNLVGTTGNPTLRQSGTGLLKFTSALTATGAGSKTLILSGSTAGTGELAGAVVNNSGTNTTSITKTGTGTWTLSGASTYTGTTAVEGGTLIAGANAPSASNGAFGNASSEVSLGVAGGNNNASILIGGAFGVGRNIRLLTNNTTDAGTRILTLGGNTAHNSIFSGDVTLGTASQAGRGLTLTAASGGQVTFSGVIQDPATMDATAYTVTKAGSGTVVFSNTNTYTGATSVTQGTLLVNGSTASTSAVSVSSGATLGGTGTVGGAVSIAGFLSPGASIETLGTGTLSFANSSTLVHELDSSVAASVGSDLLKVTGNLNLVGTVGLSLDDIALADVAFTVGDVFSLINYTGTWNNGLFTFGLNELADEEEFTFGLNTWRISYNDATGGLNYTGEYAGGSDSFVNLTVVPESRAALLGGLGMLALLRRRRDA